MENIVPNNPKIEFDEVSRVFQGGLSMVQGNHEALPEFMNDVSVLLTKASKKLSTTQLVLIVAGLAVATILVTKKIEESNN